MKQPPEEHLYSRQSVQWRFDVALRRLHDETATAAYASQSCPANFREPILPVFMLIAERDGAVMSLRISRDISRDAHPYHINIHELRRDRSQEGSKRTNWVDEETVQSFINELLMLADKGDLGLSSWMHFGQNMLANPLSGLSQNEREPFSDMSTWTAP